MDHVALFGPVRAVPAARARRARARAGAQRAQGLSAVPAGPEEATMHASPILSPIRRPLRCTFLTASSR
jgi:hypothetical protein